MRVGSGASGVSLAGISSSSVLCVSLLVTVYFLQRAYQRSYARDRLPIDTLLRRKGKTDLENDTSQGTGGGPRGSRRKTVTVVHPAYHGFALGVCLLFFLQAAAWLLPKQSPYDKLSTTVFALCTFVDLAPVIHMTRPTGARFWTSLLLAGLLAVGLLAFVILLRTTETCEWCSLHFPRPGVQYAYTLFGLYFLTVGVMSRYRLRAWPMRLPPRPALAPWAFTLSFTYLLSALGLWLLNSKVNSNLQEAAFCMLDIVLVQYAIMYAPMFYRAIVSDSEYMRRMDMKQALQSSAFAPLLGGGGGARVGYGALSEDDSDSSSISGRRKGMGQGHDGGGHMQDYGHDNDDDAEMDEELQAMVNDPNLHVIDATQIVRHRRVGSGGYGSVWYAEWRGCDCAVKELFALAPLQGASAAEGRAAAKALLHEVAVLARLRHPHCVLFYGLVISQHLHGIVTEYMDGGSVHDIMHIKRRKLTPEEKQRVLRHTASGMAYLHTLEPPLVHRDLKTKNLLADAHLTVIKVRGVGGCGEMCRAVVPGWIRGMDLTAGRSFSFGPGWRHAACDF